MKSRFLPYAASVLLCFVQPLEAGQKSSTKPCSGVWSSMARSPYALEADYASVDVHSPDEKYSIKGTANGLMLVSATDTQLLNDLVTPPLSEVLWAQNARNFAINFSDGGAVGTWKTAVYSVSQDGILSRVLLNPDTIRLMNSLPRCVDKEDANIGVITFFHRANEMLIATEVPPHSSCKNMGATIAYRISLRSGNVLGVMRADALHKKHQVSLGCRLMRRD